MIGRPQVVTEVTLQKLEEVFALGGSDKEACLYADISPSTLYNYQKENPDFLERKELLKEQPILKARRVVIDAISKDSNLAFKYLERRKRDEFNPRIDLNKEGFEPIRVTLVNYSDVVNDSNE